MADKSQPAPSVDRGRLMYRATHGTAEERKEARRRLGLNPHAQAPPRPIVPARPRPTDS
jgi:hypothetical protein